VFFLQELVGVEKINGAHDRMASAKEARLRVMTLNVCLLPPFCRNRNLPTMVSDLSPSCASFGRSDPSASSAQEQAPRHRHCTAQKTGRRQRGNECRCPSRKIDRMRRWTGSHARGPAVLVGVAELGAGGALRLPPRCQRNWRNRRAAGVRERVLARFHSRRANLRGERVRLTTAHECMHACLSRTRARLRTRTPLALTHGRARS
jgi:hypothetical protein